MCSTVQIYYEQIFKNSDESAARPRQGGAVSCVNVPALQSQTRGRCRVGVKPTKLPGKV